MLVPEQRDQQLIVQRERVVFEMRSGRRASESNLDRLAGTTCAIPAQAHALSSRAFTIGESSVARAWCSISIFRHRSRRRPVAPAVSDVQEIEHS